MTRGTPPDRDQTDGHRPRIRRVLETALYVDDMARAVQFYSDVMGLAVMLQEERLTALDGGAGSVLLLFLRGATTQGFVTDGGFIPPHDGQGPAHFAFAIVARDLDAWRRQLVANGVEIESEVQWENGGVSLYFRDPDGHAVELATPGIWPNY
jgi:catechol 2,3-dioxygenase-like lactoylglutathione lyase family enzyme